MESAVIKLMGAIVCALIPVIIIVWKKRKDLKEIFKPNKKSLTQLIEDSVSLQKVLKDVLIISGADRVGLYFSDSYDVGLRIEKGGSSNIKVIGTHEVTLPEIGSVINHLKEVSMFLMNPYIKGIIDNDGVLILDTDNTPESNEVVSQTKNEGVKSAVWHGIKRSHENVNMIDYYIGAMIISFIKREHRFNKEQLAVFSAKCETIAYMVENIYLKNKKNIK